MLEALKLLLIVAMIYGGACFTLHCLIVRPWETKSHSPFNPKLFRRRP